MFASMTGYQINVNAVLEKDIPSSPTLKANVLKG
jgi:hypothetical protein